MNAAKDLPRWRYLARVSLFIVLLAFMAWGPFSRQILNSNHDLFRPWIMFKGIAVGVVDARFYRQLPGDQLVLLDRYKILGYDNWRRAPKSVRRFKGKGSAVKMGRRLCARLGRDVDIRVVSRIATRKGWREEETGDRNICTGRRSGR